MKKEYSIYAKLYDPILYFAIKSIRKAVMHELSEFKDMAIIDICCGTGNQLKLLSKNGFKNLHCLDISESMLDVAQQGDHPIKFYAEDATKMSFENEMFDVAILSFAIHEKDRKTQENLMCEAYRILKNKGIMLVVDYVSDSETAYPGKTAIRLIEWIAGGEHYKNFKNYIENDGLRGLINTEKFKRLSSGRKLFNAIILSIYQKAADDSDGSMPTRQA
ncbi:class I SAM-dependent methyltransferase [candidate division KSB1 bacterium]|nr:class I SAM-dependent methyltransferase [candidate division KSB1 bacterium]